jgi:hypothetical protein
VLCAAVASPASAQRGDRRVELILKVSRKINSTSKWFVWSLDTMAAIRAGDVPPPPPGVFAATAIESVLQDNLAEVKNFALPTFAAPIMQLGRDAPISEPRRLLITRSAPAEAATAASKLNEYIGPLEILHRG